MHQALHTSQSAVLWRLPGQAVLTSLSLVKGEDIPWRRQGCEFWVLSPGKLWPQASSCCESLVHHRLETWTRWEGGRQGRALNYRDTGQGQSPCAGIVQGSLRDGQRQL